MNEEFPQPPAASAPLLPEPAPASEFAPAAPWGLRDLASFLLVVFPAFLLATLATSAVYGVLRTLFGWKLVADLAHNAFFIVPMQTLFYGLLFGFLYALTVLRYQTSFWRAIAWSPIKAQDRISYLFAGWVLAVGVQLASALVPPKQKLPLDQLFTGPAAAYTVAVFGILIAPLIEEIVFRGFIFAVLDRMWGGAAAVLGSGALFGAIHMPQLWGGWLQIALLFVVGVVFGLARARTGSIVPSLLMHVCYNSTIFVYFYLSTDGFRHLSG